MTIADKILSIIDAQPAGWVFSAIDFTNLGTRDGIDKALSRLVSGNILRRLTAGLYDRPVKHPMFGDLPPDLTQVAHAWARKYGYKLQFSPAHAANYLGLSDQVPAHLVYLTDGPSKVITIGKQTIKLVHVTAKKLVGAGTKTGLVVQSLYYFGKNHVTSAVLEKALQHLQKDDKNQLKNITYLCPLWMQPILRDIA